jgi:hypothetical protein
MIALAMVGMFTASALAEVNLYGSARMWTYTVTTSNDALSSSYDDNDDTDTTWAIGPFSRFGATFKNGDVGGKFELDGRTTAGKSASSVGSLRMRHLYGTWNFGAGELLVGQTWPVTDQPISGLQFSGDGLQSFGGVGAVDARIPQIRLTFGSFRIAFLTPDVNDGLKQFQTGAGPFTDLWGQTAATTDDVFVADTSHTDTDVTLPKIEADFMMSLGDLGSLTAFAGYQTYDMQDNGDNGSEAVVSWLVGVKAKFNFGPAYVNAIVDYEINPANYGESIGRGVSGFAAWDSVDEKLYDYKNMGYALVVGFKVNDMVSIEAGYGANKGEWDVTDSPEQDNAAYYIQVPITLADGVRIVPEFVKFDYGETKAGSDKFEQGDQTALGAVWYISF